MSRSNRSNGFATITATVVAIEVILIGFFAFSVGVSHAERQFRAEQNANYISDSANDSIAAACAGVPGARLIECVRQEVEASNEHRRSEYDLSAQQDMADYAFWLMWISVATVAVTALGVWFVKRTLDATFDVVADTSAATKAMLNANRIMQENRRPWLDFEILDFELRHATSFTDGKISPYFYVTFKVKNWGKSPAFWVTPVTCSPETSAI